MASFIDRGKIEEIALRYAELVKKELKVHSIYLYGSFVKGTYTEDSDIDIAVVGDEFSGDKVDDTVRLMKIRRKVDNRIEPHPFKSDEFDMSDPFVQEIVNTGIRIM